MNWPQPVARQVIAQGFVPHCAARNVDHWHTCDVNEWTHRRWSIFNTALATIAATVAALAAVGTWLLPDPLHDKSPISPGVLGTSTTITSQPASTQGLETLQQFGRDNEDLGDTPCFDVVAGTGIVMSSTKGLAEGSSPVKPASCYGSHSGVILISLSGDSDMSDNIDDCDGKDHDVETPLVAELGSKGLVFTVPISGDSEVNAICIAVYEVATTALPDWPTATSG
jgi:hypothetical protein